MKNWLDIVLPHEEIRQEWFDEVVFAADLGGVAAGVALAHYNDLYLFFKNAYLTDGLTQHTFWGDVTSAEDVWQKTPEQTIIETVRQIGARVEEDKRNRDNSTGYSRGQRPDPGGRAPSSRGYAQLVAQGTPWYDVAV